MSAGTAEPQSGEKMDRRNTLFFLFSFLDLLPRSETDVALQILSKSNLDKCEKNTAGNGGDTTKIVLSLAVISGSVCRSITSKSGASSSKLPPGPRQILFFGNLFDLINKPRQSLAELAKTHGPILSLKLGSVVMVVVSSDALAREVFKTNDLIFCNRFIPDVIRAHQHHELAMPWVPISPLWRSLRKLSNVHVFASQKLDANYYLRRMKIEQLLSVVEKSCRLGEVVDVGQAAFNTTLNLMSTTVFSIDLADSDSQVAQELRKSFLGFSAETGKLNLVDFFPMLRKFDPQGARRRMSNHFRMFEELCDRMYEERVQLRKGEGFVPTSDVLDTLVDIIENKTEELLNKQHMMHLLLDLFVAGTDPTTSTAEWAMAELLHNPKVLQKAQAELEEVIGKGKQVEESDMARLPYLEAIIKETLRLHPSLFLIPRMAGADVEIGGFTVPAGAHVLVNAWGIGRDPNIWEKPEFFMPERFLGSEIDVKGRNFELIPFGGGRRMCPGMPLAMRMLHLMLGSLINCFQWKLEDGVTPENMNMDDKFEFTLLRAQPLRAIPFHLQQ